MKFLKSGLQTSLQDFGRQGFMHLGFSQSGAMDKTSLSIANWLVGNSIDSPAFEIALVGPTIEFETETIIAICGAHFDLYLNGNLVFNNETINVNPGDQLEFDKLISGARAYLAFSGSLEIEPVLNSFSTNTTVNIGGFNNRALIDGDRIKLSQSDAVAKRKIELPSKDSYSVNYLLRCSESVETDLFSADEFELFFSNTYTVDHQSNRMGIRLHQIKTDSRGTNRANNIEMTSSGLVQGSIQITPSGQPIISSVDGQTIGGYPRIANIISSDLAMLGQVKSGDKLEFSFVNQKQAQALNAKYDKWLKRIID